MLLDELVRVHYRVFWIRSYPGNYDANQEDEALEQSYELSCEGQVNGLCGAVVPGMLSFTTGMHTGKVPVRVEVHDAEPALDPVWQEAVEVSFTPRGPDVYLELWEGPALPLPALEERDYRMRYCAADFNQQEDEITDSPERYLIQLWPAGPQPDSVLRQTSDFAAYWHRLAQKTERSR